MRFEVKDQDNVLGASLKSTLRSDSPLRLNHQDLSEAVEQIEDVMDCLWSYRTALALAGSDPSTDLEFPALVEEVKTLSLNNPQGSTSGVDDEHRPTEKDSVKVIGEPEASTKKPSEVYSVRKFWRREWKNAMTLVPGTWLQVKCKRSDGKF